MHGKILALLFVAALTLTACSRSENKPSETPTASVPAATPAESLPPDAEPPPNVVEATALEVELPAGGAAEVALKVIIAKGYHINGNPASKYQIATTLDLAAGDGIMAAKPVYPASITKKFSFSNEPIAVYEDEVVIKQQLRAEASAPKGSRRLGGKLKVQPCDDKVCFPPRTLDVSVPVVVK